MRRNLFTTLLLCLMANLSLTAQAVEGKIRYLVQHDYTKKMIPIDYISQQQKDRSAYMWGGSNAIWEEYEELWLKPNQSKYIQSTESVKAEQERYSWRKELYFRYHDYDQKRAYHAEAIQSKRYLVDDTLRVPVWKVLNDLKEVAGHLCMNATYYDSLRLQRVVAWFALDMPHPAGPDRFIGLPGVVLEVNVNDGAMVMTANKIELRALTNELDKPEKVKAKKLKYAQYDDALRKQMAEARKMERPYFWGIRY